MSNIIKGSALQRSNPRLIELAGIGLLETAPPQTHSAERPREEEREQFEYLRLESQKVLQETEAMIVDLLEKAREESGAIMAAARDEAEIMQIQASQAAHEMKEKALKDGYRDGLEQARLETAALKARAEEESRSLVENARAQKLQTIRDCEADILRLSMAIARKVVAAELATNPDVILGVIRDATALLDSPDNITVHVNPAELDQVLEEIGSGLYSDANQGMIQVKAVADHRISAGGCTLESEVGMIDARLETRLDNMEQLLREVSGDD